MGVTQVLNMNKGNNENSYAKNSFVQKKIIGVVYPIIEEAILRMFCVDIPQSIGIADLGCSSGPNAMLAISEIINVISAKCHNLNCLIPEHRIYLNDLPTNDFNYLFSSLPKKLCFEKCFVSGVPGSFYGRLFPDKSLHFVHSSSSLHWLSQAPLDIDINTSTNLNKGEIYITKESPSYVLDAYALQFKCDFTYFLKSRSEEIVGGGGMVLSFMGRKFSNPTIEQGCYNHLALLAQALMALTKEGIIEEEKVDSFNAPYYAPCPEEIELYIRKEGSFIINKLETFEIDWDGECLNSSEEDQTNKMNETLGNDHLKLSSGEKVGKTIRAATESMLQSHFGEHVMEVLFERYAKLVDDHLTKKNSKYINLVIALTKKDYIK